MGRQFHRGRVPRPRDVAAAARRGERRAGVLARGSARSRAGLGDEVPALRGYSWNVSSLSGMEDLVGGGGVMGVTGWWGGLLLGSGGRKWGSGVVT